MWAVIVVVSSTESGGNIELTFRFSFCKRKLPTSMSYPGEPIIRHMFLTLIYWGGGGGALECDIFDIFNAIEVTLNELRGQKSEKQSPWQ